MQKNCLCWLPEQCAQASNMSHVGTGLLGEQTAHEKPVQYLVFTYSGFSERNIWPSFNHIYMAIATCTYSSASRKHFLCLGTRLDSFTIWIPTALPLVPFQPHYSAALKTVSRHENLDGFFDLLDVQAE